MNANLTTLENVKAFLGTTGSADDALLTRLVGQASRFILAHLSRDTLWKKQRVEYYHGLGNAVQILKNWPVTSVDGLTVDSVSVPAADLSNLASSSGYFFAPDEGIPPGKMREINLQGYYFTKGKMNVVVTYTTGYWVKDEAQTIPAGSPYTITLSPSYGSFANDEGVKFASNGAALTKVTSAPAAGQYSVSSAGVYTFNSADTGKGVLISYSFTPADLEQACIELIAERYKYKDRIGQNSKSLGGQETVSFSTKSLNDYTSDLLYPYQRVIPVYNAAS